MVLTHNYYILFLSDLTDLSDLFILKTLIKGKKLDKTYLYACTTFQYHDVIYYKTLWSLPVVSLSVVIPKEIYV